MQKYKIKRNSSDTILGILNYDELKKEYTIDILPIEITDAPFLFSIFMKKGIYHIDSYWSKRWVSVRIIPIERQNIGEILRVNHMKYYDDHQLLVKNQGRCCQDELYIESF